MHVTIQCLCGHTYLSDRPEHIQRDAIRAANGYLDALPIPAKECEQCSAECENLYDDLRHDSLYDNFDDFVRQDG